ncbi:MAG TPA: hypothetical protein VEB41_16685 [Burkholderiales bacterium]|nr:hypothetical protein [Burkholderiales bacterium]
MKRLLIIALLAASPSAGAQKASEAQNRIVGEVAQCLQAGLPPNWQTAEMKVELKKPGAESGQVSYITRRALSGGEFEPFRPCDEKKAARTLLDLRKHQDAQRRAWTAARLIIRNDGTYDLTFEYPAPKKK